MNVSDNASERIHDKLSLQQISMIYSHRRQPVVAVHNLSFSVADKEFVAILGPSGCGKTTLLRLIAGFIRPTSGIVRLNGQMVRQPGPDRGVIFQRHALFPWRTIRENIAFGQQVRQLPTQQRSAVVSAYLKEIGLEDFANYYPADLSEGMRQRVGIARVFANDPDILLMDEPFAALDAQTSMQMQALLSRLWRDKPKTIVFITHNIDEAIWLADRVILLSSRPAHLKADIRVDLPRPRSRNVFADPSYIALRKELIESIFAENSSSS